MTEVEIPAGHGDGSHAPKLGSEIEIFELATGDYYILVFTPQTGGLPHAISIPKDEAQPHELKRLPAPGEHGYLLHAQLHPPGAPGAPGALLGVAGRIGFGHPPDPGNEDNDTATFTATKQRP